MSSSTALPWAKMSTPRSVCDDFSRMPSQPETLQPSPASTTLPPGTSLASHDFLQSCLSLRSAGVISSPLRITLKVLSITVNRLASCLRSASLSMVRFRWSFLMRISVPLASLVGPERSAITWGSYCFPFGQAFMSSKFRRRQMALPFLMVRTSSSEAMPKAESLPMPLRPIKGRPFSDVVVPVSCRRFRPMRK